MDFKDLKTRDPLQRHVEKGLEEGELSPMDPPDAYAPPHLEAVAYDKMHPYLQKLMDEHTIFKKELDCFEKTLIEIQSQGIQKETDRNLRDFFHFFDHQILPHGQKEDKFLFPLLHQRLLENKEHGHGAEKITVVDILEDDHVKMIQIASVVFNFLGLAVRLPNPPSRLMVLDAALEQGKALVELLRLHIFREDCIVFPLANKYIDSGEFFNFS